MNDTEKIYFFKVHIETPDEIKYGFPFKLKCNVAGLIAKAVDIIWDSDPMIKSSKWKSGTLREIIQSHKVLHNVVLAVVSVFFLVLFEVHF